MASQERWAWEEQCDTLLCEAIAALGRYNGSLDATLWTVIATRGPLTVSRHTGDAPTTRLAGTGYIHGRLEDITRGLYCDTDDDLIGNEAVLTGEPVLDGAVLQALEKRGAETPFRFAGVKWVATQCGGQERDLLTFERMGMTLDSDNTEVAYHVVYAIPDHADWPTATQLCAVSNIYRQRKAPVGITRLEPFALCYLYRKVSEDLVLCFILGEYWGQASAKEQREAEHVLAQRVLMVSNALVCCEAKILTKMLHHCKDVPVQMSKTCLRCRTTRGTVTSPLRLCGICRKSTCSTCHSLKTTCRVDPHAKLAETEAFCVRCLIRANIPTAPSSEVRRGLRNVERDQLERRQRRDSHHQNQHYQHHRHERRHVGTELRPRAHANHRGPRADVRSDFIPTHSYNYDGLMRRASSGSLEVPGASTPAGEQGRERGGPTHRRTEPSLGAASHRGRNDLYLRGSFLNSASNEAERRYQLHLERDKRLSERDLLQPERQQSSDEYTRRHGTSTAIPDANSPSTIRNQKTVREFYRDLYSDM